MTALLSTGNAPHKAEMEYHGENGHNIGRIQQIALMSRIEMFYTKCRLSNQTVAHSLPGFQGLKRCVQHLVSHPHKPIFYRSYSYDGSNVIRLTWSGNQVEYYTTQSCLEYHQFGDHDRIINRRRSVSSMIHTLLGTDVCCKV